MKRIFCYCLGFCCFWFCVCAIDTELYNWHYFHRIVWSLESVIYWILGLSCGFGAVYLGKRLHPRRNRYTS